MWAMLDTFLCQTKTTYSRCVVICFSKDNPKGAAANQNWTQIGPSVFNFDENWTAHDRQR